MTNSDQETSADNARIASGSVPQISHEDPDAQFTLSFPNGEREVREAEYILKAVELCNQMEDSPAPKPGSYIESLGVILKAVDEWTKSHAEHIRGAFLSLDAFSTKGHMKVLLLVEQKTEEYDERIDDSLIDLDIAVNGDPKVQAASLAVLLIPPCDDEGRATFLSSSVPPIRIGAESNANEGSSS